MRSTRRSALKLIRAFALNIPPPNGPDTGRGTLRRRLHGHADLIPQILDEQTVLAATKDVPQSTVDREHPQRLRLKRC